ncbi:MAG: co-chaperone GroES [Chloroflexota bacterium]|nr:co-chaperone GroES [Chloroflexota bacterium]
MAQSATATKLRPMGDRVVIRPAAREETTRSGIVLPDTSREKPQRGEVIAVGNGRITDEGKRLDMDLKVGDTVLFAKYAGTEFRLDDEDLLILSEKDVLAIVNE